MAQVLRLFFITAVVLMTLLKLVGATSYDYVAYKDYSSIDKSDIQKSYFANDEVFIRYSIPSDLKQEGIKEVIGTGKSIFPDSTEARLQNILVATEKFNGVVVQKGEVFSFNEILQSVGKKDGYVSDLVIKGGRMVYEQGGGVCQLSTTIFRAALDAGLEIVSRKGHSVAIPYYKPYGLDSAIYMPYLDLQFRNNTPGDILIQTRLRGEELYVVFLGTNDGREVRVEGPFYDKYAKNAEALASLEPADPYDERYDYRGFSVQWIWKVKMPGEPLKEEVLTSYYRRGL